MKKDSYTQQRGSILTTTLFIVFAMVIAGLIYIMAGGDVPRIGQSHGTDAISTNDDIAPHNGGIDGLGDATDTKTYPLDEFGAGISRIDTFAIDINHDGTNDRITRTHHETGNAHPYDEYKIELNKNGQMTDITPDGFRTVVGTECTLQKLHFTLRPKFQVVKISRPWNETWETPTMATKTTVELDGDKIKPVATTDLKSVCDVSELF